MDYIYVTGHKNPDTDSIVSAMAFSALRNALGEREYQPARLGHVSDETMRILSYFGFEPPMYLSTMRTQIRDLEYDTPPALNSAVTVNRAWDALQSSSIIPAVPITDDDGKLFGMLSPSDIASYNMRTITEPYLTKMPVFNLLSVLEGTLIGSQSHQTDSVTGEVIVALPRANTKEPRYRKDSVVLCGQQPEAVAEALACNVSCIVLCQAQIDDEILAAAQESCIISTPFDACRCARLLFQALPVERICRTSELIYVNQDDFLDDVRELVTQSRFRSYPILDEAEHVVGTLSRFHLIRPRRKRVVLVDHNEFAQSVPGLDQAEILAIIDHHRLADIQTGSPIYFRNEPVGSTATIVAGMYQEEGIMPPPKLAGLMAAAILSDTVMFKSPTCTSRDVQMAERMSRIADVSLTEIGQIIFAVSGMDGRPAKDLLLEDFKEFHIASNSFAIGQITCVDSSKMLERKADFLAEMAVQKEENGFDMILLMITDVLLSGSYLLCIGDEAILRQAFNAEIRDHECFLPQVISRKKQIVPMLSAIWG